MRKIGYHSRREEEGWDGGEKEEKKGELNRSKGTCKSRKLRRQKAEHISNMGNQRVEHRRR